MNENSINHAAMLKDLKLAQSAAQSAGANTPLGAEAAQLYLLFASLGHSGADFSGIIQMLRGTPHRISSTKLTALAGFVLVPFALWGKTAFLAERVLGNV